MAEELKGLLSPQLLSLLGVFALPPDMGQGADTSREGVTLQVRGDSVPEFIHLSSHLGWINPGGSVGVMGSGECL